MAHADFHRAVAQPVKLVEAIARYRANETALRRLAQSRPTRNIRTTAQAIAWREADRTQIEGQLVLGSYTALVGWLTEERKLLERLGKARRAHIARPELATRLTTVRQAIRRIVQAR